MNDNHKNQATASESDEWIAVNMDNLNNSSIPEVRKLSESLEIQAALGCLTYCSNCLHGALEPLPDHGQCLIECTSAFGFHWNFETVDFDGRTPPTCLGFEPRLEKEETRGE